MVQPGDTLAKIAAAFGLPIQAIMELNGIVDPNNIEAGQILQLPLPSEIVVTSLPAVTTQSGRPAPVTTALPARHDRRSVDLRDELRSGRPPTTGASRSRSTPRTRASPAGRTGFVCSPTPIRGPAREYEALEYMDWKSGGDTNFAPLASADGELDCRGFWDKGKTDKDALWTSNADVGPPCATTSTRSAPTSAGCA